MEAKMPVRNFAGAFAGGVLGLLAFARLVPANDVLSRWILLVTGSSFGAVLGFFYAEVWYGGRAIVWGSLQLVGRFFTRHYARAIAYTHRTHVRSQRLSVAASPYLRPETYASAIRQTPRALRVFAGFLLDAILCIPKGIFRWLFGTAEKMVSTVRFVAMLLLIPGTVLAGTDALHALGLLRGDSILMPVISVLIVVGTTLFTAILSEDLATTINPHSVISDTVRDDESLQEQGRREREAWQIYTEQRYAKSRASFFWWLMRRFFVAFILAEIGITTTVVLVVVTGSLALAAVIVLSVGAWILVGLRKVITDYGYVPCLVVTVSTTALVAWRAQTLLESNFWLGASALTVGCVAGAITEALRLGGVWVIRRLPAVERIEEHNRTARSTIGDHWLAAIEKFFVNTMSVMLGALPA